MAGRSACLGAPSAGSGCETPHWIFGMDVASDGAQLPRWMECCIETRAATRCHRSPFKRPAVSDVCGSSASLGRFPQPSHDDNHHDGNHDNKS